MTEVRGERNQMAARQENRMKYCELKINNYRDRSACCGILANAGYAVRVEERSMTDSEVSGLRIRSDWFVIVEKDGDNE